MQQVNAHQHCCVYPSICLMLIKALKWSRFISSRLTLLGFIAAMLKFYLARESIVFSEQRLHIYKEGKHLIDGVIGKASGYSLFLLTLLDNSSFFFVYNSLRLILSSIVYSFISLISSTIIHLSEKLSLYINMKQGVVVPKSCNVEELTVSECFAPTALLSWFLGIPELPY